MDSSLLMYHVTVEHDGGCKGRRNMESWSFIDRDVALRAVESSNQRWANKNPKIHIDVNKITSTNVQSIDYPFEAKDLLG